MIGTNHDSFFLGDNLETLFTLCYNGRLGQVKFYTSANDCLMIFLLKNPSFLNKKLLSPVIPEMMLDERAPPEVLSVFFTSEDSDDERDELKLFSWQ